MIRIIRFSFYLLFFFTPLLFFPWTFELFEFNKMMFVYLMTTIIATAWAAQMILTRIILVKRTPLDFPIMLFLASQILSTYFSIHPHTSLIGYYSRFHGGLLSTLSYTLLYYAFVTFMGTIDQKEVSSIKYHVLSKKNQAHNTLYIIHNTYVRTCLNLLLTSATLVATYGIAEHFGIDKHLWVQDVQRRVFSTLGQPNWLAAFLIMVIPLTWALSVSSSSALYIILNTLYFATLLFTKSRSGILGFGISYLIFWLLTLLKGHFPWKKFIALSLMLLALSTFDGLSWIEPVNHLRQQFLKPSALSLPRRQAGIQPLAPEAPYRGEGGTESGEIRKIVWKGAIEIWKHYPYFGSGVETFAYAYYNFRPVEHNLVSEWDFLYNKAHNEYLNFLATTGTFGLGSYLLLQLWVFLYLLKQIFSRSLSIINYQLSISLLAAYSGVAVSNFFGFSTVAVSLLFFLYPAMAVVLTQQQSVVSSQQSAEKYKFSFLFVPLLLATGYLLLALTRWYLADMNFASGKRYGEAGYLSQAYPKLATAVSLLPYEPTYHNELSSISADIALTFHSQQATESATQAINLALSESDLTQIQNPVHVNFIKTRARVMFTLAQIDPIYLQEAKTTLLRGLELSPTDAKLMYNLALLYQQLDQPDQALSMLEKTVAQKANYEAARQSLGLMYEERKDTAKAIEQYEYILKHIAPRNTKVKESLEKLTQ